MLEPKNWKWRTYMYTCYMATHNFHYNLSYAEANHNIFFVSGSSWGFFGALNLKLPFATIRCLCACCRPGGYIVEPQRSVQDESLSARNAEFSQCGASALRAGCEPQRSKPHISSVLHWECRHEKCILDGSIFSPQTWSFSFPKELN